MSIKLQELVDRFGGQLIGDGDVEVVGFAPLNDAGVDSITFLTNPNVKSNCFKLKMAI